MSKKFEEANALNGVGAFHRLFDLPILESPQIPSVERCKLRIALLEEELNELKEAINNNDLMEAADAFCDLQYVLSGAIHEFGLGARFHTMFEEVQRSNMSKACQTMEEAQLTQDKYQREKDTVSEIRTKEDVFLVYRAEDGKVLKSINYSPADLSKFI
ncbi:MAG: nucleoside triphosphate pyrophosphohydrolase family protein [Saprospiraceae bacterium]|nr:nucleoside triphosphate pyrophosphohydrolase family protein [Saprospiraceae bacterium]MBK9221647.1 nucleoside triphosphate pyrophosphohydrolase family protein [Saprospiraceae bacterium]